MEDVVRDAVKRLGGSQYTYSRIDQDMRPHDVVVTCSGVRTIKVLHAIAAGAWVVGPGWAEASICEGQWQPLEKYEHYSAQFPGAKEARLAAMGQTEGTKLLRGMSIFIKGEPSMPPEKLKPLIVAAGGKVVNTLGRATHCVVGPTELSSGIHMPAFNHKWICDSVAHHQLLPFDQYEPVRLGPGSSSQEF